MKYIIFTLLINTIFIGQIFAQNGSKEDIDLMDIQMELQEKIQSMNKELDIAMDDLESVVDDIQINDVDGNKMIIIDGDTVVINGTDNLPGFMGEAFKQMPENIDASMFEGMLDLMKDFQAKLFNFELFDAYEPEMLDNQPNQKPKNNNLKTPQNNKKRKSYSL